jgi:outer membrane protein assembly factor BamB
VASLNERHWVVLGNAMNNPGLMALYRRKYAFVDDYYPGGDGYVIRTVHNPESRGHNVLLVGASTPEGGKAALDRLEGVLQDNGKQLGYTNVAASNTHEGLMPRTTPDAFREQMEAAYLGNALRGPIEQGVTLGLAHHFTHDPDCARMFRDVLFYYEDLVRNRHDGEWCFEHMLFIYAWTWRLFHNWDLIEESDAFTDEERLRMTNLLWGLTHYVAGLSYFAKDEEPRLEIRQNHPTFAALSMSGSAGYFKTYYGVEDFEKELRFSQIIFDGQANCYKPNDDGGGGGYCWLVPNHQMIYDLKRDEFRFLDGGHLREIANYAILICDNLGSPVGFGDVGAYGARRSASSGVASTLCKAAWHYDEGSYLWALEWMGGGPEHDCFYKDLPRQIPEHMLGIALAPFNPPLYDWVEHNAPQGPNVAPEEAFDKLCLRDGFDEEDMYLLLDGTSTFAHGHEDGNSIERLTWKGRMWLAETDYIWKRPKHHSSVVSICDGESGAMPSLVALEWAQDLRDRAFTRTTVPGYNATDWTRDMMWVKGRYLLVADSLKLLEDGDYDLRCLWRTLGDVDLEEGNLVVEQEGVFFGIRSGDESEKALEVEEPRIADRDPYASYDYADGPTRILKQEKTLHGSEGDVERYFNLLVAGSRGEIEACKVERIGDGMVRITDGSGSTVFGVCEGDVRLGGFRIEAEAFALTGDSIVLLNGKSLSIEDVSVRSQEPFFLAVHPGEGRGEIRVAQETEVGVSGVPGIRFEGGSVVASGGTTLGPGTYELRFEPMPTDALWEAVRTGATYTHRRAPKANRFEPVGTDALSPAWETTVQGAVRCLDAEDGAIALGTEAGEVALLGVDGAKSWSHQTDGEVRTVRLTDVGGGRLLTGGRDCALTLLDEAGAARWKRDFIPSHGRDQIVNDVVTADVTGDGKDEILVATDGWLVWALTQQSEEIWQRQIEHHAAQTLVVDDVDGDGRQEILVGTEYHTSNMLEADGAVRWTVRGGPCFTALALVDLNGDGVKESVYGAMNGEVYAVDSTSGSTLWTVNLGDDVRHGFAVGTPDGTAFVAGSESGNVALLSGEGERLWRRDLDAPVTGLALLGGGQDVIAAGTAAGWVVLLSLEGEIVGCHQMEAGVSALTAAALDDGSAGLVVGAEDGRVVALGQD